MSQAKTCCPEESKLLATFTSCSESSQSLASPKAMEAAIASKLKGSGSEADGHRVEAKLHALDVPRHSLPVELSVERSDSENQLGSRDRSLPPRGEKVASRPCRSACESEPLPRACPGSVCVAGSLTKGEDERPVPRRCLESLGDCRCSAGWRDSPENGTDRSADRLLVSSLVSEPPPVGRASRDPHRLDLVLLGRLALAELKLPLSKIGRELERPRSGRLRCAG